MIPELDFLAFIMPAGPDTSSPVALPAALPQFVLHFKLIMFSTVDASIWFRRAEVKFCLKKVMNSRTQADHVLAAKPDTLFPQMSDWLDSKGNTPIDFQDLKTFLLKKFSPSAEKRINMLFDLLKQVLGDQRPSETLTEMRSLCRLPPDTTGNSKTIDILLALWLRRLPDPVHAAITNFSDFTDNDLVARADSLLDAHNVASRPPIHTTTPPDPPNEDHLLSNPPDDTVAAASPFHRPPSHGKALTQSRTQDPRPRPQKDTSSSSSFRRTDFASKQCYYHTRFGPAAKKCEKPCAWSKNAL